LPIPVENELLTLYPTLMNRYVRQYFISDDKKIRITLDKDLSFFRIHAGENFFKVSYHLSEDVIMEMKYDPGNETIANDVSQGFPFRITKSSKYVTGVQKLFVIV
jgi:SPX domain protein involved in polyphosphate accumulation